MADYTKFDSAVSAANKLKGRKKVDKLKEAAKLHPSVNLVNEQ